MSLAAPHTFATSEVATAVNINSLANWFTLPRLRLDNTGGLTALATGTLTTVTFTVADIVDSDAMHDTSTNPTRIIAQTLGFYILRVRVAWGTAVTGTYRTCQLFKNGSFLTAHATSAALMAAAASNGTAEHVFTERAATAGDYFEVKLAQDTGGTVSPVVNVEVVWRCTT